MSFSLPNLGISNALTMVPTGVGEAAQFVTAGAAPLGAKIGEAFGRDAPRVNRYQSALHALASTTAAAPIVGPAAIGVFAWHNVEDKGALWRLYGTAVASFTSTLAALPFTHRPGALIFAGALSAVPSLLKEAANIIRPNEERAGVRTAIADGLDRASAFAGGGATKLGEGIAYAGKRINEAFQDETVGSRHEAKWAVGTSLSTFVPLGGSLATFLQGTFGYLTGRIDANTAWRLHTTAAASLLAFATVQSATGNSIAGCIASGIPGVVEACREYANLRNSAEEAPKV